MFIKYWKLYVWVVVFLFCFNYANADESTSLTNKTQVFIPISSASFNLIEIPFYPLEDPEMTYLFSAIRQLPKEYRMKICLDGVCVQQSDILGPLEKKDSYTLSIGVIAPEEIEEGKELSARWAIGPELGEDSSSSVIIQIYVYPMNHKHISMVLDKKEVYVNKDLRLLDVPAQVMQGRTMIPFRFLGEQLGAKVSYEMNPETRLVSNVSFSLGKLTVKLWINKTEAEIRIDREIELSHLDVAPVIQNGRTLVPVRFVAEQMGARVEWIADKRQVNIYFPCSDDITNEQFHLFFQHISPKELHDNLEELPWKIIDLRIEDDYKKGHLPGAIHLPLELISEETLAELQISKDDYLVLYCNSGVQSVMGAERMIRLKMRNVFSLTGGFTSWPYDIDS